MVPDKSCRPVQAMRLMAFEVVYQHLIRQLLNDQFLMTGKSRLLIVCFLFHAYLLLMWKWFRNERNSNKKMTQRRLRAPRQESKSKSANNWQLNISHSGQRQDVALACLDA